MVYNSVREVESRTFEGVRFQVSRISFARRLELTRQVRELGKRIAFDEAGEGTDGKLSAAIARAEIERLYLRWGLVSLEGLVIDGKAATPESLIESGPEELCREIVAEVRRECGLSEEERKN